MLSATAKKELEYMIAPARKMPSDEVLSSFFLKAMLGVCDLCVPSELLRVGESEDRVYRNIANGHFICFPDKPNFSDEKEHIMIDEPLTYAVLNLVAFEITGEDKYIILADRIVGNFIANEGESRVWV